MIGEFKKFLADRFGSIRKAWKTALDVEHTGVLSKDLFVTIMTRNGYEGDAAYLFELLDVDRHHHITLYDIDLTSYTESLDKTTDAVNDMAKKDKFASPHTTHRSDHLRTETRYQKEKREESVERERDATCRPNDFDGFMVQLYRKYRTPAYAFQHLFNYREHQDELYRVPNFQESCSFHAFATAVRKVVGFAGDVRKLWVDL